MSSDGDGSKPETPKRRQGDGEKFRTGINFIGENAMSVAVLAVAGFSIMYACDDLEDGRLRRQFIENIRRLRKEVPRARAFLILDALNELHPDRDRLDALTREMRRYP